MYGSLDFDGQVIVVVGGASGIGRKTAYNFAEHGGTTVIADIDAEGAEETVAEIERRYGESATAVRLDVTDHDECRTVVDAIAEEFGRIDVVVNCAADRSWDSLDDRLKPFVEKTPEDWQRHIETSFNGTVNVAHAVLPHMIERGRGAIVNFTSEARKAYEPGMPVYGGAQAAVASFTEAIAKQVGEHGIRVNAISPAITDTPVIEDLFEPTEEGEKNELQEVMEQYPLGRIGQPEDHADLCVFLASDAASWITGQSISVNGGNP